MATDKHEQIRQRAYEIWEEEGRPVGAELRHWLQASDEFSEDEEPRPPEGLSDKDDRDTTALLQGVGENGSRTTH